jgi:hypothetical protein
MVNQFNKNQRSMPEMLNERIYSAYHILTLIDMYAQQSKEGKQISNIENEIT